MRLRVVTIAIAAFATMIAVGIPAAEAQPAPPATPATPSGIVINRPANPCVLKNNLGWCINNTNNISEFGNSQPNGNPIQQWQREPQGEPNNDWEYVEVGVVTPTNGGWPWPNTLLTPSSGEWSQACGDRVALDQCFRGNSIGMFVFSPNAFVTNYCLAEDVTSFGAGSGPAIGWTCDDNSPPTSLDQLWMGVVPSSGDNDCRVINCTYVNVRGASDAASTNSTLGAPVLFSSGTRSGIHLVVVGMVPDSSPVAPGQAFAWYPCFNQNC